MKKALFFRIGAIGDVLLTTPAVQYFKINNPDFEIHYLAGYPAVKILENNPYIDKVLLFKEVKTRFPRFINALLAGKNIKNTTDPFYDIFFDFESSYYSAYLSFHVNAKEKSGFKITQKRRFYMNLLYTCRLDYRQENCYIALKFIELMKKYCGDKNSFITNPVLVLSADEKELAKNTLQKMGLKPGDEKLVMVCISGTWMSKNGRFTTGFYYLKN